MTLSRSGRGLMRSIGNPRSVTRARRRMTERVQSRKLFGKQVVFNIYKVNCVRNGRAQRDG